MRTWENLVSFCLVLSHQDLPSVCCSDESTRSIEAADLRSPDAPADTRSALGWDLTYFLLFFILFIRQDADEAIDSGLFFFSSAEQLFFFHLS